MSLDSTKAWSHQEHMHYNPYMEEVAHTSRNVTNLLPWKEVGATIDTIPHGYETSRKSNTKSHADVIRFCVYALFS